MKKVLFFWLLFAGAVYAGSGMLSSKGMSISLYDDTAFGFSFDIDGTGSFLRPNRPPTSILMMSMDGRSFPIGSAIGFFHQRPVVTNNGIFVAWEARRLLCEIFVAAHTLSPGREGFLVTLSVSNLDRRSAAFGVQALFDVVVPFAEPIFIGNDRLRITQESVWQGRSLVTQWALYSQQTNLPGITVAAVSPSWQTLAFAQWKQFFDFPGDTVIRRMGLFVDLISSGVSFFYPTTRLEGGARTTISYWIEKSLPPEGVVRTIAPRPLPTNTNQAVVRTEPQPTNTNQVVVGVEPAPTDTNQVAVRKAPEEWRLVLDGFAVRQHRLTLAQERELEGWFSLLSEVPSIEFEIVGHADVRGTVAKNRRLGQSRAEAVATWLRRQGVSPQRLRVSSRGESEPIAGADDAENRRVEIVAKRKHE